MNVSTVEKMRVIAQVRSAIEICFAHRCDVPDVIFEKEFDRWIEAVALIKERREFSLATMRFMALFRNGHTMFNDRWLWRTAGLPTGFATRKIENSWVVTATAVPELELGDRLLAIEGETMPAWVERLSPFVSSSTDWSREEAIFSRFYSLPANFELQLAGGRSVQIERGKWSLRRSLSPSLIPGDVPILKIPSFSSPEYEMAAIDLLARVANSSAVVVDIRGNSGGNTPLKLLSRLMDRPYAGWSEQTPSLTGLHYTFGERPDPVEYPAQIYEPEPAAFRGEVVILVDASTASAAEDFAAPFQQNGRAIIVGRTTAGSSGQPFVKDFGNDMVLVVGSKRETFSGGGRFEGVGIVPHVKIELVVDDIRNGVDRDYLQALASLRQ